MKVGVWIGPDHEVLYDSLTDEVVFREIHTEKPRVIRFAYMDLVRARVTSGREIPSQTSKKARKAR